MGGMNLIHLAAGVDVGTIFWFIVIGIFIIVQIVKSRKQFNESAPEQQKPAGSEGDPAEELRKFLEGLNKPQEQPKPPPAPAAAQPPPAAAHPRRHVPPPRTKHRDSRPVVASVKATVVREETHAVTLPPPPPQPDEAAVLARYRSEMIAHAPVRTESKWHTVLKPELLGRDRQALRKAFLLREILGAPTALRRREVVYPLV